QKRASTEVPDRKADVIPQSSRCDRDENDVGQRQLVRISRETRQQENGFTGQRKPGVLEQESGGDCPVTIVSQKVAQQIEKVRHEEGWRSRAEYLIPRLRLGLGEELQDDAI